MSKSKSSLLFIGLLALPLWAKPVAQVTEVTGAVFAITPEGKTLALKPQSHIEDKTELMVEEGASITLNDYYDATYHLIGGTHLKFYDKSVQLKRGKVWVESGTTKLPLALTTANGSVDFWKSEFIATFEQSNSRSQVLVVNGEVEVSNILDKNMKYTVSAGAFSLIDPEVENGAPRAPTKVGLLSLNKALSEFKTIPEQLKTEPTAAVARTIASVEETPAVKKGEIIFFSSGRLPASVQGDAHQYFKKKVAKKKKAPPMAGPVVVRFYGLAPEVSSPRGPASVQPSKPSAAAAVQRVNQVNIDAEFSSSLQSEMAKQPKHSEELDNLIKDLQSY